MVRSRFKKPVRLAVLVIKSGEELRELVFLEIIGIGSRRWLMKMVWRRLSDHK